MMGIELGDGVEVAGIWFIATHDRDWMATISRTPGEPWKAAYRFRYYVDDKAHGSADRKSGYTVTAKDVDSGPERLIGGMETVARATRKLGFGEGLPITADDYFEGMHTGAEVVNWLAFRPWAHVRVEKVDKSS